MAKSSPSSVKRAQPAATGRELDQLCRFAASLGTTLDVDTLVEDAVEPLMAMSSATHLCIAVAQSDARALIPEAGPWPFDPQHRSIPAPPVASLGTEAVGFDHPEELPPQLKSRIGVVNGAVAVVPMWAHAHLRGVILLQRTQGRFSPHMLKMLTSAGRQLALAVENARLLADLQDSYRKLMDTQEDLIRAERLAALGQLSATMAHEIRNPLATIFSAISQLRKTGGGSEMAGTLLNIAEEEATRLNTMVSELLKFARPRKPTFEMERLDTVVAAAVKAFGQGRNSNESIVLELDKACEQVVVSFDSDLIRRAVTLLLENAFDAISERDGDGQVVVSVHSRPVGAVITVKDNGAGIPDELMPKVFEPFYSTRPTGTGLGLPTVKRIAEDHRGCIEISTEQGMGTTVRLFIQTRPRHTSKD